MTLILRDVQARRRQSTLLGRSPVESHRDMARANRTLGDMLRTMKHATDQNRWRAGHGSPADQLDGATLLLDLLQLSRAC